MNFNVRPWQLLFNDLCTAHDFPHFAVACLARQCFQTARIHFAAHSSRRAWRWRSPQRRKLWLTRTWREKRRKGEERSYGGRGVLDSNRFTFVSFTEATALWRWGRVFPLRCASLKDRLHILSNVARLITFCTQCHRIPHGYEKITGCKSLRPRTAISPRWRAVSGVSLHLCPHLFPSPRCLRASRGRVTIIRSLPCPHR